MILEEQLRHCPKFALHSGLFGGFGSTFCVKKCKCALGIVTFFTVLFAVLFRWRPFVLAPRTVVAFFEIEPFTLALRVRGRVLFALGRVFAMSLSRASGAAFSLDYCSATSSETSASRSTCCSSRFIRASRRRRR